MPEVARLGDPGVVHCSGFVIATASTDVFVNDRGAVRVGDSSSSHLRPAGRRCAGHVSSIASGSSTVFVNNRPIVRRGDPFGGCTQVAQGSPDVIAG